MDSPPGGMEDRVIEAAIAAARVARAGALSHRITSRCLGEGQLVAAAQMVGIVCGVPAARAREVLEQLASGAPDEVGVEVRKFRRRCGLTETSPQC